MASLKKTKTSELQALNNLFTLHKEVTPTEALAVSLPTSATSYFNMGLREERSEHTQHVGVSCEEAKITHQLPTNRIERYAIYEIMANDPTIDSAIKMHIANALSSKSDNEEVIKFEPINHNDQKYAQDLNATFSTIIKKYIDDWAYQASLYGACYVRVYGEAGKGVTNVRCDYYTLPRFVNKYEKGGTHIGFTSAYQGTSPFSQNKQIQLIEPWKFVGFELPSWNTTHFAMPVSYGAHPVDLSLDNYEDESIIESQDYGSSLLQTAYQPWRDLLDAIRSLKTSRMNAARLERLVGIHTNKLDPQKASDYVNMIAAQISETSTSLTQMAYDNGNSQTVINHLFPVFGDKGGIDINTVQGTPDITGLEDVLFYVKRLGSALGIDPSLLGFGDFLSGGLGDGGFFRVSIMAAIKANALRRAIANGLQRLAELHIAYKHNKVFAPNTCPWKISFNSVSTAIERELQESLDHHLNTVSSLVGIVATMDQEFGIADKREFLRYIWRDILKKDEESFEMTFPKNKENNKENNEENYE